MSWVRIVDIHSEDMFYEDRNRLVGKKMELLKEYRRHLSRRVKKRGWCGADLRDEDGNDYVFYAVKYIPEDEWQELRRDHIRESMK